MTLHDRLLRRALLAAALASLPFGKAAFAADATAAPRTYAVLSLVGDEFSVVLRRRQTGSNIDANDRRTFAIDDAQLDGVAANAAERAIQAANPDAPRLRFSIRDQRLFALQDALLTPGAQSDGVREELRGLLAKSGATHLVLVTKRRDEARFELYDGGVGAGKIAGAGFYVDNLTRTKRVATGESSVGYVGVYAYVTATLVDVAAMRPLAVRHATGTRMSTPADAPNAVVAWDATSEAQKSRLLTRMIDTAVFNATRDVLAAH